MICRKVFYIICLQIVISEAIQYYHNIEEQFWENNFSNKSKNRYGHYWRGNSKNQFKFVKKKQSKPKQHCGVAPERCFISKYRTYDGSCNNLLKPGLGMANTPYNRLIPPIYSDGVLKPARAKSGNPLPLARELSLLLYPDVPIDDPILNLNAMQYGQIVTHDMSMMAGSSQTEPYRSKCCTEEGRLLPSFMKDCFPIVTPYYDHARLFYNKQCMSFQRTPTDVESRCTKRRRNANQLSSVNHYLDLSLVYGNSKKDNKRLRLFQGGLLRVDIRAGQQWLPRTENGTGCRGMGESDACYLAGDPRVNQNPQLTLLHIVFVREHNRIANHLSHINPFWCDEIIFQEARKINIAIHQQISYYEWLPYFIGLENCIKNRILWTTYDHVNDYDPTVDPSVLNEHANGAFRLFHSTIVGRLHFVSESRKSLRAVRLSDHLVNPQILEEENGFDLLLRGLTTQSQSAVDEFHDSEVTQHLFRNHNETFGIDLKAFDIQRNRDHGLASYNDYREFWGMSRAKRFEDFNDLIGKENILKLAHIYESPDDVDLIVGGSLEALIPGTLAGPTFLRILTEQFFRTRVGDRFWFEHDSPGGFTLEQLWEIRKVSISRLLCDNGQDIRFMQPRGFERISDRNPLVPCESLPSINLHKWKERKILRTYYSNFD